jgi:Protein of unknown function (DUF2523)
MPWIASVILSGLIQIASTLVGRVLLAMGLGFVEFAGIDTLLSTVKTAATSAFDGLGASGLLEWAGFFRIDIHLSIILSAIGVKVALNALGGSRVRRLVSK